jgi:uncharacterized protein
VSQMGPLQAMADIFVDTSGWATLFDPKETHYSSAALLYRTGRQQGHTFVTTNYVIGELVSLLTSPFRVPRIKIIPYIDGLRTSPHVQVVHIDAQLDERAWQRLKARRDKDWSLVDCSSYVLMEQRGITQALTTDHHFEQAGFIRLLKSF